MNNLDLSEPLTPTFIFDEIFEEYKCMLPPLIPVTTDIKSEIENLEKDFEATFQRIYVNQRAVYKCQETMNVLMNILDKKLHKLTESLTDQRKSGAEISVANQFKDLWC